MALQSAQLVSAITATGLTIQLQSLSANAAANLPAIGAMALPVGIPMQIDGELMFAVAQPVANTITVRGRGSDGTPAIPHDLLSNVFFSATPTDFPVASAGTMITVDLSQDAPITIGQDSTITAPANANTVYNINKASACNITLNAPSLSAQATEIAFTSQTAAAHVITATGLINDAAAGAPHSTASFAAQKGATITFLAENGFWNIKAAVGVTIT